MNRRFSIPILAWVVIGLVLMATLPLVAAWFQTERNIDSIIRQTQQTHQVIARATAERLASRIDAYRGIVAELADDPQVYLQPDGEEAGQALVDAFARLNDAQTLSLFVRQEGEDQLLFTARLPDTRLRPADHVALDLDPLPHVSLRDGRYMLRIQKQTTRPNTFVHLLAMLAPVSELPTPELGDDASLLLVDAESGAVLDGDRATLALIPDDMLRAMSMESISAANNSFQSGDSPLVYAFAKVADLPLRVVSMQPARAAESARVEINRTAVLTFAGVLAAVLLLSIGAWVLVVKPIREIVSAGQELLGGKQGEGGDMAQLRDAFERLEDALRERDAVTEIFLGRYQIVRRLGSGAMGTVYLAWDPKLEREVALKTVKLAPDLPDRERKELSRGLLQEAKLAAQLNHGNVVVIYDVLGDEDTAFIAMEFVEGASLDQRVRSVGPLGPSRIVEVARGILSGVAAAHAKDVIHRDIKPANVMLSLDGTVKVSDFGIAGVHGAGGERVVMGTPGYLAPECYMTGGYDARTDLFAVGVTLVECMTGRVVFAGRNTAQIIARTQSRDVVLPGPVREVLPASMVALVDSLLMKDPAGRPESADAALRMIADIDTASLPAEAELLDIPEMESGNNANTIFDRTAPTLRH